MSVTISKSFTAVGNGLELYVRHGDSFTFSVSGTFAGTVVLERSLNGGISWEPIRTKTAADSGLIIVEVANGSSAIYRYRCSAYTSGTIVTSMTEVAKVLFELKNNRGAVAFQVTEDGISVGGGVSTFISLTDVPSAYTSQALKVVRVNAGETALEFSAAGSGDVAGPASSTDNAIARFDSTTGKIVQDSGVVVSDNAVITATGASGLDGATPVGIDFRTTSNGTWTDESILSQIIFSSSDTNGNAGTRSAIKCYADDTSGADNGISFYTTSNGNTGIQEQARIDHQGFLGIGTITPSHRIDIAGNINTTRVTAPTAPSGVEGSGTGLGAGTYKYKIAYYTTNSATPTEAGSASANITIAENKSIDLTIPVSSDPKVTGRKIYRTLAGGSVYYFVANVANNTATTYTDTTPDASISSNVQAPTQNLTGARYLIAGAQYMVLMASSTYLGASAGSNTEAGQENTCIGSSSGLYIKNASFCTFVGHRAGMGNISDTNISGDYNTAVGRQTLSGLSTGHRNNCFGMGAGSQITTGAYNICIGVDTYKDDAGNHNIMMGYHTGFAMTSGDGNIFIGDTVNTSIGVSDNSILIGYNASSAESLTNAIAIGYSSSVTASNSFVLGGTGANQVSVGVGTTAPDQKALLDLTSTTRGFLPPRMTSTQRDAISSPPSGLVIYNTTTGKLNVHGASAWEAVTSV